MIDYIAGQFVGSSELKTIKSFGSGNINDTFLVRCPQGDTAEFILQRINQAVFSRPENIVRNMQLVNNHLTERQATGNLEVHWQIPKPISTISGEFFLRDNQGEFWRAMSFLENCVSYNTIQTKSHAFEAGRALGKMHELLHDLDPGSLTPVIPGFHDTVIYLKKYKKIHSHINRPYTEEEQFCHELIDSKEGIASLLDKTLRAKKIGLRAIHGDPKISNIMVDPNTYITTGMVDLDTIGPGLIQHDIGDCLRSCCNTAGEEKSTPAEVDFDLKLCETIMAGYYREAAECISQNDRASFFDGLLQITYELGLRFFIDHLAGNVYFKVDSPQQNLQRALRQFRLVEIIESKEEPLRALFAASE